MFTIWKITDHKFFIVKTINKKFLYQVIPKYAELCGLIASYKTLKYVDIVQHI